MSVYATYCPKCHKVSGLMWLQKKCPVCGCESCTQLRTEINTFNQHTLQQQIKEIGSALAEDDPRRKYITDKPVSVDDDKKQKEEVEKYIDDVINEKKNKEAQELKAKQAEERVNKINSILGDKKPQKYEYLVQTIMDNSDGYPPVNEVTNLLNLCASYGWELDKVYTNEIGRNSHSAGYNGFSSGSNSTVDENIFIFKRPVE